MTQRPAPDHDPRPRRVTTSRTPAEPVTERAPSTPPLATEMLRLQHAAGNRTIQRVLEQGEHPSAMPPIQRKVEKVEGERVEVANDEEKAEAEAIIKRIKETYGISVSSKTTIEGIKEGYPDAKEKIKKKLSTRRWRLVELRALEAALGHYAPILGAERAKSTRSGDDQEVTSVGKVAYSIDEDTPAGKLDPDTLGEYFKSKKNMGLFKPSEGFTADFADEKDQLVGTFVHETGHGLLTYALKDFIAETGYWKDEDTKLPTKKRTEDPPTSYGKTNAEEDLCETAMIYFVKPERLEKSSPKRYAFMQKTKTGWLPPPKEAPALKPEPAEVPKAATVAPVPDDGGGGVLGLVKLFEQLALKQAEDVAKTTPSKKG